MYLASRSSLRSFGSGRVHLPASKQGSHGGQQVQPIELAKGGP